MTNWFWGYVLWCSGVLSPRPFPCSLLYLAFIWTTSRQVTHLDACLISLGDFRTEGPLYAHLNAIKIGHQTTYKRVICLFYVCIVLLNTFKMLFVLICLLCFDSRKDDGECTGFLPIIALNSNTIKYTVSSHFYQVTNQFFLDLVYLIYHTLLECVSEEICQETPFLYWQLLTVYAMKRGISTNESWQNILQN